MTAPLLFPLDPADIEARVFEEVARAWGKAIDKTLSMALDAYNLQLLQTQSLAECKQQLRLSDHLDGDVMVYWEPTDALLGLFCHPRLVTRHFPPTVSMSYRLPTAEEQAELANWGH